MPLLLSLFPFFFPFPFLILQTKERSFHAKR